MPTIPTPLVSVGVPVRNGAATLSRALDSLLAQTHTNLEILISDNASTDETMVLCEAVALADARVSYLRLQTDIGAVANFKSVLDRAAGEYFMWAAADDYWMPDFIQRNLAVLTANKNVVGSVSRVLWDKDGAQVERASGTQSIGGSTSQRLREYFRSVADNSRFYGLFRTDVLKASIPDDEFYGWDLGVMAGTLIRGTHFEVPEELMVRSYSDPDSYIRGIAIPSETTLFPLWHMTKWLYGAARVPVRPGLAWWILARNVTNHLRLMERKPGLYARLCGLLLGGLRPALDRRRRVTVG